ncbi:MAG: hypothetical protein K8T90_18980 [Planctomycetes bacterium]|nr:hypothetical protein [Planctomycetota bacterium]
MTDVGTSAATGAARRATPGAQFVFWTEVSTAPGTLNHTTLHRGVLDATGTSVASHGSIVVPGGAVSVSGLAVDPVRHTLYGTFGSQAKVWRLKDALAPDFTKVSIQVLPLNFPAGTPPTADFYGIAYDPKANRLYVAEQQANWIWTIHLGTKPLAAELFAAAVSPSALAIDGKAGRLYWGVVDEKVRPYRRLQKAPLVKRGEPVVFIDMPTTVAAGGPRSVNGVVVDAKRKAVYFIEVGQPPLLRIGMEPGAAVAQALKVADDQPVGLAFDPVQKRLFWGSEDEANGRLWTSVIGNSGAVSPPVALVTPGAGRTIGRVAFLRQE